MGDVRAGNRIQGGTPPCIPEEVMPVPQAGRSPNRACRH